MHQYVDTLAIVKTDVDYRFGDKSMHLCEFEMCERLQLFCYNEKIMTFQQILDEIGLVGDITSKYTIIDTKNFSRKTSQILLNAIKNFNSDFHIPQIGDHIVLNVNLAWYITKFGEFCSTTISIFTKGFCENFAIALSHKTGLKVANLNCEIKMTCGEWLFVQGTHTFCIDDYGNYWDIQACHTPESFMALWKNEYKRSYVVVIENYEIDDIIWKFERIIRNIKSKDYTFMFVSDYVESIVDYFLACVIGAD